jgi:hypothetical protein
MHVLKTGRESATVDLTSHEVIMLNNALNEVTSGIDIPGFSTQMGADLSEARALLRQIGDVIKTMENG